LELEAW